MTFFAHLTQNCQYDIGNKITSHCFLHFSGTKLPRDNLSTRVYSRAEKRSSSFRNLHPKPYNLTMTWQNLLFLTVQIIHPWITLETKKISVNLRRIVFVLSAESLPRWCTFWRHSGWSRNKRTRSLPVEATLFLLLIGRSQGQLLQHAKLFEIRKKIVINTHWRLRVNRRKTYREHHRCQSAAHDQRPSLRRVPTLCLW